MTSSIGQALGTPATAASSQDFFAMFEVAPGLLLDADAVRRRYFERVRQLHPDLLAEDAAGGASPEEREMRLGMTAHLNDGWRALSRLDSRAEALVRLYRPGDDVAAPVPAALLGEAFDLGESIDAAVAGPMGARADALGPIRQRVASLRAEAERELLDVGGRWEALGRPPEDAAHLTSLHRELLDAVRAVLGRLRLLDRLLARIEGEAGVASERAA